MSKMLLRAGGLAIALWCSTLLNAPLAPAAQPAPAEPADSSQLLIVIQRQSYDPPYPTVPAGTTVTWVNRDREQHTVTNDEGLFDGSLDARGRFSFTFTEPGHYFFYCKPHDWMIGEITVEGTSLDPSATGEDATPI
jgi:plastocyanin